MSNPSIYPYHSLRYCLKLFRGCHWRTSWGLHWNSIHPNPWGGTHTMGSKIMSLTVPSKKSLAHHGENHLRTSSIPAKTLPRQEWHSVRTMRLGVLASELVLARNTQWGNLMKSHEESQPMKKSENTYWTLKRNATKRIADEIKWKRAEV